MFTCSNESEGIQVICSCCHKERECPETIILSEEDKLTVAKMSGKAPPDSFSYCAPCWRVLSDRKKGANLLRGQYQELLRKTGHSNPSAAGKAYYNYLTNLGTKDPKP
jgi:hypothetical protein